MNKILQKIFDPIVKPIYTWLDTYFSQEEMGLIESLNKKITIAEEQLTAEKELMAFDRGLWEAKEATYTDKLVEYEKKLAAFDEIPEEFDIIREEYDTKYPKRSLAYQGRPITTTKGVIKPVIKLPNYIFDFQALRDEMVKRKLTLEQYQERYSDYATAVDKCREAIYKFQLSARRYMYDKDQFGTTEFWSGPFISWHLKQDGIRYMDCEDSSLLLMAMFKAAGIPRGFQRAFCGMTKLGGHCAVAVYSLKEEIWYHYETTAKSDYRFKLHDETPSISIIDTWFSFDWMYSWSQNPKLLTKFQDVKNTNVFHERDILTRVN